MSKQRFKLVATAHLLLVKDKKILLIQRKNTLYYDGYYGVPAGHIDGKETVTTTMLREAKEEINVKLKKINLNLVHVMHRIGAITDKDPEYHERLDFFFQTKYWQGKPKNMEPEKCDDLNWFDVNNLPENTIPYIKQAIENIQKGIVYSESGWKE